jgi:hypothetical protein
MIFRRAQVELTAAERRLYAALRRDVEIDAGHEDRTVAALRAAGLPGAPSRVASTAPHSAKTARRRVTAIIAASAALVVAVTGTTTLLLHARRGDGRSMPVDSAALPAASLASTQHHAGPPTVAGADSVTTTGTHSSYLVWY